MLQKYWHTVKGDNSTQISHYNIGLVLPVRTVIQRLLEIYHLQMVTHTQYFQVKNKRYIIYTVCNSDVFHYLIYTEQSHEHELIYRKWVIHITKST